MNFYFRADGNARIGMGHIMRCMTIAAELSKKMTDDDRLCFLCADKDSSDIVTGRGFEAVTLGTDYKDMESELPAIKNLLSGGKTDDTVTLVDSYEVTDEYLKKLAEYSRVYYMDDMQDRRYPVDGVINYNGYADKEYYKETYASTGTACYIGNRFVPIREEFLNRDYKVKKEVSNVLITTGGGDIQNIAGEITEELIRVSKGKDVTYHIIAGHFNPNMDALEAMAKENSNIVIHEHVDNMAELMCSCDLAVSAGGSTMYELCAIGLPFICFSYAENQEQNADYMDSKAIADDAGAYHKKARLTIENIGRIFKQYTDHYDIRLHHSNMGKEIVDGKGAGRIARVLSGDER